MGCSINETLTRLPSTVLLLYDWVIALPREVQMFWMGSPGALSATLYFTNRSVSLLVAGVRVLALVVVSDKVRSHVLTRKHITSLTTSFLAISKGVSRSLRARIQVVLH